ncbi:MAG: SUMF1/EgtB/PvdO family nonheme iron enzyme [Magnetococcales bacterium]|nr:SUMF1/EgtB/PvdO family nonheme iron enzyme [Magnetococcales bacterium]
MSRKTITKTFFLSLLAIAALDAQAAAPTCANPIPDVTWSGTGSKSFTVPTMTFRDSDFDDLTYSAKQLDGLALPSWLQFDPATRIFSGNPPAGTAKYQLKVTANDGHNGTAVCAFSLNLVNANDTPTVRNEIPNQAWTRGVSQSFQFSSTAFRDRDGDSLRYTAKLADGSSLPGWLRFSSSTRRFTGTPPANASSVNIRVTASDSNGGTVSDTFTLSFPSNHAPVAARDTLTVTGTQAVSDTLTATDADGDALTYRIITNGTKGRVTLTNASTGAFTYTPNSGATGSDSFTFKANDGKTDSNLATITVTLVAVTNARPVASAGTLTVSQGIAGTGTLQATDADAGDALIYRIVSNGTKGTATITNASTGEYRYTPNSGATGSDTFTFKANDGTVDSTAATITVMINALASEVTNSLGMTFKRIPSGTFTMGSPSGETNHESDEVQHQVTISRAFYMQTTEITQGQWRAVMGSNPSYFSSCGDTCPVEQVSWNDLQDFISQLNSRGEGRYRLPTEAEWEYAARSGTTTAYSFGNSSSNLSDYAWWGCNNGGNSECKTHPVAQKLPNLWGLYDMHGNVWEWISDRYESYTSSAVTDPHVYSGPRGVFRGGSWANVAGHSRCANRFGGSTPDIHDTGVGARLVKVP